MGKKLTYLGFYCWEKYLEIRHHFCHQILGSWNNHILNSILLFIWCYHLATCHWINRSRLSFTHSYKYPFISWHSWGWWIKPPHGLFMCYIYLINISWVFCVLLLKYYLLAEVCKGTECLHSPPSSVVWQKRLFTPTGEHGGTMAEGGPQLTLCPSYSPAPDNSHWHIKGSIFIHPEENRDTMPGDNPD